jgi:hypothetical protein
VQTDPAPQLRQAPEAMAPNGDRGGDAGAEGPADLVAGAYHGDVVADANGGSRNDITLTIRKIDPWTVRVRSDDPGLGVIDVRLTRVGDRVLNAGGDTTLVLDLTQTPPILDVNARGTVAYRGEQQP